MHFFYVGLDIRRLINPSFVILRKVFSICFQEGTVMHLLAWHIWLWLSMFLDLGVLSHCDLYLLSQNTVFSLRGTENLCFLRTDFLLTMQAHSFLCKSVNSLLIQYCYLLLLLYIFLWYLCNHHNHVIWLFLLGYVWFWHSIPVCTDRSSLPWQRSYLFDLFFTILQVSVWF